MSFALDSMDYPVRLFKCAAPWIAASGEPVGPFAIDGLFSIDGWQRSGSRYEATLLAWRDNFEQHWPTLKATLDDRFYRM